eukprot:7086297-Ditylum_brightwellii.AAC.1
MKVKASEADVLKDIVKLAKSSKAAVSELREHLKKKSMKAVSSVVNKPPSKKIYISDNFDLEHDRPKCALERKRLDNIVRNANMLESLNNKVANLKHKSDGIQV